MVIGATVPCCERATAASEVILAFGVAPLTTKTGTGRDDNEFRDGNHALDRHGNGRRRVDDRQLEPLLAQYRQIRGKPGYSGLREGRQIGFPFVPPIGQ